jgi:hypothetical protein
MCVLMVLLIIAHPGSIAEPRLPNLEVVVVGPRKLDGGWRGGSKRDIGSRSVGERRNVTINHFGVESCMRDSGELEGDQINI